MNRLVDYAEQQDAVSFKQGFEERLASKVTETLEALKMDVASRFFNAPESQKVEECGMSGAPVKAKKMPPPPAKGKSKLPLTREEVEQVDEVLDTAKTAKKYAKAAYKRMKDAVKTGDKAKARKKLGQWEKFRAKS